MVHYDLSEHRPTFLVLLSCQVKYRSLMALVHGVKGAFFIVVAERRNSKNSSEAYKVSYHDEGVDTNKLVSR